MSLTERTNVLTMLVAIEQKLNNIENILQTMVNKKNSDSDYDELDDLRDSMELTSTPMIEHTDSDSDTDSNNMLIDESYDSENDIPTEKAEVFPESKITLTPLQIQLANEEFMQYRNVPNEDSDSSESSS